MHVYSFVIFPVYTHIYIFILVWAHYTNDERVADQISYITRNVLTITKLEHVVNINIQSMLIGITWSVRINLSSLYIIHILPK